MLLIMRQKKWKPSGLPSEDGLLGLLLEAGGETLYFMMDHNLEEQEQPTKTLIATSLYPIYIAKTFLQRTKGYFNKKMIK